MAKKKEGHHALSSGGGRGGRRRRSLLHALALSTRGGACTPVKPAARASTHLGGEDDAPGLEEALHKAAAAIAPHHRSVRQWAPQRARLQSEARRAGCADGRQMRWGRWEVRQAAAAGSAGGSSRPEPCAHCSGCIDSRTTYASAAQGPSCRGCTARRSGQGSRRCPRSGQHAAIGTVSLAPSRTCWAVA